MVPCQAGARGPPPALLLELRPRRPNQQVQLRKGDNMDKATVLVTGMALLGILSIGLAAMLYQLVKQQGRLLLRLDQVERQLGIDPSQSIDRVTVRLQSGNPAGLPIGTVLPDFALPDLDGRQVSSEIGRAHV